MLSCILHLAAAHANWTCLLQIADLEFTLSEDEIAQVSPVLAPQVCQTGALRKALLRDFSFRATSYLILFAGHGPHLYVQTSQRHCQD